MIEGLLLGDPQIITDIQVEFGDLQHLISQATIRKERIYDQESLATHIKKALRVPYTFQIVRGDRILTPFSVLFNPPDVLRVRVVYKFIINKKEKETKKAENEKKSIKGPKIPKDVDFKSFFEQRDMDLQKDIIEAQGFQECINKLKCQFTLSPEALDDLKQDVWQTIAENEASKGFLIRKIIEFAVKSQPLLRIKDQFRIEISDRHVTVDRAVLEMFGDRAILICEDKYSQRDLVEGLAENFDQAKFYSLTKQGRQYPLVYGIISNFNEWKICCYYLQDPEIVETKRNFHVTSSFTLMRKDLDPKGNVEEIIAAFDLIEERVNELIGWIKGIFRKDVDNIVSETLGLKIDLTKLEDVTKKSTQRERGFLIQCENNKRLLAAAPFLKNYIEGEGKKILKSE